MERQPLGPGSRLGHRASPRTARALQMHIVDQPAAAVGAHDVDRQHLIAIRPLQLDPERPQLVVPRNDERSFDDAVAGMIEILLNDGETLAQHFVVHRIGRGAALRAPQLAHALLIVGLDRREKLRDGFVHRLRDRTRLLRMPAGGAAGKHEHCNREPSLHEARPVVTVNRR